MPWLTLPLHPVPPVSSALSPDFWVPLVAIVLLGAALVAVELRDPRRRLHLFCVAWMGVTFAPMMILHSMPHLVQDYYLLSAVGRMVHTAWRFDSRCCPAERACPAPRAGRSTRHARGLCGRSMEGGADLA